MARYSGPINLVIMDIAGTVCDQIELQALSG